MCGSFKYAVIEKSKTSLAHNYSPWHVYSSDDKYGFYIFGPCNHKDWNGLMYVYSANLTYCMLLCNCNLLAPCESIKQKELWAFICLKYTAFPGHLVTQVQNSLCAISYPLLKTTNDFIHSPPTWSICSTWETLTAQQAKTWTEN